MKLIIDISEEKYDWIMSHLTLDRNFRECKITPLPKGHGRLIDAERYRNEMLDSREFDFFKTLDMQPTIIEADKEN